MIKIERSAKAPESLKAQKSYTEPDVIQLLQKNFHKKCYICELGELSDSVVEHLLPHHNGEYIERKFDWNNLFLSCPHCNSVKNRARYECNIIDCCRIDPETLIDHRVNEKKVYVTCRYGIESEEAKNTAALVQDCFELRNTGIRTAGAEYRTEQLRLTKFRFERNLRKYMQMDSDTPQKQRLFRTLRGMISRKSKFSGFMRTYIRDHKYEYPEIYELVKLDCDISLAIMEGTACAKK